VENGSVIMGEINSYSRSSTCSRCHGVTTDGILPPSELVMMMAVSREGFWGFVLAVVVVVVMEIS